MIRVGKFLAFWCWKEWHLERSRYIGLTMYRIGPLRIQVSN